jgi:predicted PurR-regulated permease PerM
VEERLVTFRTRTILSVIAIVLAVLTTLFVISIARQVIAWILISLFLALALNPAVEWFQRRGLRRRGAAAGATYAVALAAIILLGATFVPTLVDQSNDFVDAVPGYVDDLTKGEGRLGFLQERYHIVARAREAIGDGGAARLLGVSGAALAVTKGVITAVVAIVTIAFLTFFMLLEGPRWVERGYSLLPDASQARWRRVGQQIYRTVGGYVAGNLLISVIAGTSSAIVLTIMDVPYSIALGLLVAILDLIPLAGATLAAIIVSAVSFLQSIEAGVVVLIFFIVYQQLENHVLQPLVYGRTVQLSPLAVLIAVLIGAKIAGILGALGAIPVAGSIQVLLVDWLDHRRHRTVDGPVSEPARAPP